MTKVTFYSKVGISAEEHDAFVTQHEQVNLLQSSNWAKVKDQWENERIGIYKGNQQVASLSLLIKPLPLGMTIIYIPRGPVMDYEDYDLVTFTMNTLKDYGKLKKALFIKCDPAILLKQYSLGQEGEEKSTALTAIADSIQPRFQANVYPEKDHHLTFPKHTRRLMKDAMQRGVRTYRARPSEIEQFSAVVSLTEKRKNISLRNKAYFKKLMAIYGDRAYLHLAKVNISQQLTYYQQQLAVVNEEIELTQPHQKKRLKKLEEQKSSLERYIVDFETFETSSLKMLL